VAVAVSAYPAYYYIRNDFHALQETMLHEYVPFIALLGSLFLISGGIRLTGDLRATPMVNSLFLLTGTLLASFIGTTGASMLLIRALIETNRERRYKVHTIIFFIFLVSNIGGCLLPIGDPPLFLGYLAGIPFFWTLNLWKLWLPTWIFVLALYFLLDRHYLQKEPERMREWDVEAVRPLRLQGSINFLWLAGVVASVIFLNENAAVPLFRVMYMREGAMALMVALSLVTTPRGLRAANRFTLAPIGEVAALFLGIFTTVIPALTLLNVRGGELGVNTPFEFFWGTGILSSFLDNAPTYFVFFKTASGLVSSGAVEAVTLVGLGADRIPERFLTAISVGSVFLGAMTYIGNGPNFMVKAIAEESGVKMPTFLGYMKWSAIVLLPVFAIMSWWFFL
jgi:Na+/H+ antiporter NhaD/arsenite permease-like protein